MSFQVFDERIAAAYVSSILAATGTAAVTTFTADTSTRRIDAILVTSTDTVDRYIQINFNISAADNPIGEILIPALSGHGTVPTMELIKALNLDNMPALIVPPQATIRYNAVVALTAAKAITIITTGGII